MTMNTTRLTMYCTTGEAATVIDFIDTLRDALWETYGEQITRIHHEEHDARTPHSTHCEFDFNDPLPFYHPGVSSGHPP